MTIDQVARILNEATRLFPRPDGSLPVHWEELSEEQQSRSCEAVRRLVDTFYVHFINTTAFDPDNLHDLWRELNEKDGWKHGEVYCPIEKTHPCMVDYDDLPSTEQAKDEIWAALIKIYAPYIEL